MSKTNKVITLIATVLVVSVFVYYRYAVDILQVNRNESPVPMVETLPVGTKKVSAEIKYMATEDKEDFLRFEVTVDNDGRIVDVATLDAKTGEVPEKKKEFNKGLLVVIKGKKLSELSAVDKVGTSSYTTTAFNKVIDQLKAQL